MKARKAAKLQSFTLVEDFFASPRLCEKKLIYDIQFQRDRSQMAKILGR
jgi:hypothetical protein